MPDFWLLLYKISSYIIIEFLQENLSTKIDRKIKHVKRTLWSKLAKINYKRPFFQLMRSPGLRHPI